MNWKVEEIDPLPDSTWQTAPTTTWQYDYNGNVIAVTDPLGNTTSTEYNGWNQPVAVTDALGNTTTTTYDQLGDVASTTDQLGRTTKYVYDNLGRKIGMILPNPSTARRAEARPRTTVMTPMEICGTRPARWARLRPAPTPPGISTTV